MVMGRVVGRLWASRQAAGLGGRKLLLVRVDGAGLRPAESSREVQGTLPGFLSDRPETASGKETTRLIVAVDGLDAGPGDRVIVAHGSRVRDLTVGPEVADKDVIIGIVDGYEVHGS